MGKYSIISGQNLYDVALHLYGSIEGIVDLLMNNPDLSMCTLLKNGDELEYTDDFVINPDVVAYNRMNGIVPSNSERRVYPKYPTLPCVWEIEIENAQTVVDMYITAMGKIQIDWGDNSELEEITLGNQTLKIRHTFDSPIKNNRKIRMYGDAHFRLLNWDELNPLSVCLMKPTLVEKLSVENLSCENRFLSLLTGVYELNLPGIKSESLLPLLNLTGLRKLNLTGARCSRLVIDEYLIGLVNRHDNRRSGEITLTLEPTGEYKEPKKNEDGRYVLSSGMEAIWVLTHEPAWNEANYWKFIINDQLYTYQL